MDDIRRSATFGGICDDLRLVLKREWADGPRACFIGHNPSRADHRIDDPSTIRLIHFGRAWGFAGFSLVNLYPIITPSPTEARKWARWEENGPNWCVRDEIQRNINIVVREAKAASLVVACWGAIATDEMFVDHVLELISSGEEPWPPVHVFGLTSSGSPIHPMARGRSRIPSDARPQLWRTSSRSVAGG